MAGLVFACSGTSSSPGAATQVGGSTANGIPSGGDASGGSSASLTTARLTGTATGGTSRGTGGAPATGGSAASGGSKPLGGSPATGGSNGAGGADAFWGDTTNIPTAKNVLMFKFLNRSNGVLTDSQIYWSFQNSSAGIDELHSIAEQDTYDMPANSSGRMYFYVVTNPPDPTGAATNPRKSNYYDFIEFTIGTDAYNGNTTRVDAFGLKIANRLHCADGYDAVIGEDYATFAQTRDATFAEFIAEVPAEFAHLAQSPFAPYRIVEPGAGQFKTGGTYEHYYDSWVDQLWASNNITVTKPGANCNPIQEPTLSAACYRHVGLGALNADGTLKNGNTLWQDETTFYPAAPADYYAKFWHAHAQNGKAYGFPYDDVGSWSSYISHKNPQYMLVAIGW